MRFAGGVVVSLFSLPVVYLGLQFLWDGLRIRFGDPFYVAHDYLARGVVWVAWGLLILALGSVAFLRRKGAVPALILGILLLLGAAIAIPSTLMPGHLARTGQQDVQSMMLRVSVTLSAWARQSGRFPASQDELDEFVRAPAEKEGDLITRYARDGRRVPFRLVYVADAAGPHLPSPAGDQPGIIYCAVSSDRQQFWLTGTALGEAVGGEVVILPSFEQAGPWIEKGRPEPPSQPPRK
jgi:hypothetical protein